MIKQKFEDETSDKADWLIGEGCLLPSVKGVALRSMKAPGTAYDDPRFGKDPQPATMAGGTSRPVGITAASTCTAGFRIAPSTSRLSRSAAIRGRRQARSGGRP